VPDGSATAKAIGYSLNRWAALTRYIDDGDLPIDNNWVENQSPTSGSRARRSEHCVRRQDVFAGRLRSSRMLRQRFTQSPN